MVNLWPGIPVHCLCDKHLNAVLSEYNNLLLPSLLKGNLISGYIRHGCVDLPKMNDRILECLSEAKKRGKDWKYPEPIKYDLKVLVDFYRKEFPDIDDHERRKEMAEMNKRILAFRCPECRKRIMEGLS